MDDSIGNNRRVGVGLRPTIVLGMSVMIAILMAMPMAGATGARTTFSGRAFGVSVHTAFLDLKFADTGELPAEGGEIDATVLSVTTDVAQANVLLSVTMGFDQRAQSDAAVADVTLLPESPNQITAVFVSAESVATCNGVSGSSEIVDLRVGGQSIVVGTAPNQEVNVPGVLRLVINEQIDTSNGRTSSITVNALHLTLFTGDEVIVSSAHSDITCGRGTHVQKDFMTGGGFIEVNGGKANFGFVAGLKPGKTTISGQLNYLDHASGIRVKAETITAYDGTGTTRTFSGDATINGAAGYTFSVTASDVAEPGRGADTFSISLSNGYSASGTLAGGNIQLHT